MKQREVAASAVHGGGPATQPATRTRPIRPKPVPGVAPAVAAAMNGRVRARVGRLARLATTGEQRGIAILATAVDAGAQLRAAASRLASVASRNAARVETDKEGIAILTGFQVIRTEPGTGAVALGGENDGPAGAAVLARLLLGRGTPVAVVTDTGSRRPVMESFVGAGLARPDPAAEGGYALDAGLEVLVAEIPRLPGDGDDAGTASATLKRAAELREAEANRIKRVLHRGNATTLVCIERPSPNAEGLMCNMGGEDVTPWNADLSGLLAKEGGWRPYTVGIGDGGNELGLGGLHEQVKGLRLPNGEPGVKHGERIAAAPRHRADAVMLSSVSNNGAIALSMATRAAMGEGGFEADVGTYDRVIHHLHALGISVDGVERRNSLSVDGRPLGSAQDSVANPDRMPGDAGATHHDMLREMLRIMER